jgi:DNA helicase-2/ATP-dependent DNA helicase PcrA
VESVPAGKGIAAEDSVERGRDLIAQGGDPEESLSNFEKTKRLNAEDMAITRAKERLWITYANSRYRFGSLVQNDPSRFIEEIPAVHLDKTFTGIINKPAAHTGGFGSMLNQTFDYMPSLKKLADKLAAGAPAPHTPTADFVPDEVAGMEVGMQVEHQKFGFGKILTIEGGANNRIAGIDFGTGHGVKKIMLNYAKLRIVR